MGSNQIADLIVRADGGQRMGAGHLMRCLALAQAWQAREGRVTFVSHCDSTALRRRVESTGMGWVRLSEPCPASSDLQTTLSTLEQRTTEEAPWLVLDGYHFEPTYQEAIRAAGHRLLVVDDTAHLPCYHADILLNQNIQAHRLTYVCDPDTVCLLGTRYTLLRPEFFGIGNRERPTPDVARKVLVTLGGSDPDNVTLKVIEALKLTGPLGLECRVVVGPANPHLESLRQAAEGTVHSLQILTDVTDMSQMMTWADLAIVGAGSTCWELASTGVPILALVLAENQADLAGTLGELLAATDLGNAGSLSPRCIAEALARLSNDRDLRSQMVRSGRALVDGKGAGRIADLLAQQDRGRGESALALREADSNDAFLIWRWANDPTSRANSFQPDPIPWADHLAWYQAKLGSPGTKMWILERHRAPVGHIRYDRTDAETARISFSVDADHRGKGLGRRLLELSSRQCPSLLGVRHLQGITFKSNAASARAFLGAGFHQVSEECISGVVCKVYAKELV